MSQSDNEMPLFALRILPHAERDMEAHLVRLADSEGAQVGRAWYDGLQSAIAVLSQNPTRHPIISENHRFRREVRQFLYRRTAHGAAWRVLFVVQAETDDGPTVNLIHIRHAARRPITQAEARQIEAVE